MWDDDEMYVPIQDERAGSPLLIERDDRNSLVFSTEDIKQQYNMLLRVSKGGPPDVNLKKSHNLPGLKGAVSTGRGSDPN